MPLFSPVLLCFRWIYAIITIKHDIIINIREVPLEVLKTECEGTSGLALDFQHLSREGERGGSVVECRTPEREVRGSRPTAAVL